MHEASLCSYYRAHFLRASLYVRMMRQNERRTLKLTFFFSGPKELQEERAIILQASHSHCLDTLIKMPGDVITFSRHSHVARVVSTWHEQWAIAARASRTWQPIKNRLKICGVSRLLEGCKSNYMRGATRVSMRCFASHAADWWL